MNEQSIMVAWVLAKFKIIQFSAVHFFSKTHWIDTLLLIHIENNRDDKIKPCGIHTFLLNVFLNWRNEKYCFWRQLYTFIHKTGLYKFIR